MTITASATDPSLLGEAESAYPAPAGAAASYSVQSVGRSFRLAVELHDDTWTVTDRETGIFGAGDTPSAAWIDFRRAVIEHLDVLERQEALSDVLQAQLRYLRARVDA